MNLDKLLTIVIPCKNEQENILFCLRQLNEQLGIKNTRVIISDNSDDNTRELILKNNYSNLSLEIIDGGFPAQARNNGAFITETDYILFLDADMFLSDPRTLVNSLEFMMNCSLSLVTAKIRMRGKYFYVFPIFEFFRNFFCRHSVFSGGAFMLFQKDVFFELGCFDTTHLFAEDYALSSKITCDKFGVIDKKVYTTDRRFRNQGLFFMIKMMILSFVNQNNPNFFKNDHKYWK